MKYLHEGHKRGPYFEGYYFKHQGPGGSLAFIPALHVGRDGRRESTLQVIGEDGVWQIPCPGQALSGAEDRLQLRLGESTFGQEGIRVDLEAEGLSLHGAVRYGPLTPPHGDIMGPFHLAEPVLQCYHTVVSLTHTLEGALTLNGRRLDFTGGTGYIEGDRGNSFPAEYLWTQCGWEEHCVMLSIADIPFLGRRFNGCICAVYFAGREYRLATYKGVRLEEWSARRAVIRQGHWRLEAELLEARPQPLQAPRGGFMGRTIHESLACTVRYRFWVENRLLFDHTGTRASFEYAGGAL